VNTRRPGRVLVAIAAVACVTAALASLQLPTDWLVCLTLVVSAPLVVAALRGDVIEFLEVALILLVAAGTGWLTTDEGMACTPLANLIVAFPACVATAALFEFGRRRIRCFDRVARRCG
jgi:hypothetical protein